MNIDINFVRNNYKHDYVQKTCYEREGKDNIRKQTAPYISLEER